MGCMCSKKEIEDIVVLDINDSVNVNQDEFFRKLTMNSRREKLSQMNKSYIKENEEIIENCDKTSFASETYNSKKKVDFDIFCQQVLNEINKARADPSAYAEKIRDHIKNIYSNDQNQHFFYVDLNSKFSLPKGKEAFESCIEILKNLKPMNKLAMIDELKVPFPEFNPRQATNRDYITSVLLEKANEIKDKYTLNWFHYDNNIYNAEVSTVLQLVDDNNSNGERRRHLLDDKIKYAGISVGKVKKNIYCIYLVFAS